MTNQWFDIDKAGLARQLQRRPKGFVLLELLQNAIDEDSKSVEITLFPLARGFATLSVIDDNPEGFRDLSDAYTLFKYSEKASNAEKRGRFNSGEKLVLALCHSAAVISTKGSIIFDPDGVRLHQPRQKREAGTQFTASLRMTLGEIKEAEELLRSVLLPAHVTVTYNGEELPHRVPVASFETTLTTEIDFRPTRRKTLVSLYEPQAEELPTIYELGIPVVVHDGRWHINVHQKVPLNSDRDNVTPAYLRALRTAVLDNTFALLDEDDANSTWVKDALPNATDEAVVQIVAQRFGDKAVTYDPRDPEANKRAVDEGFTLVYGGTMSKAEWDAVRRVGALVPAGQAIETKINHSDDGVPPVPWAEWRPAWHTFAAYVEQAGAHLLGFTPRVEFFNSPLGGLAGHADAWYGRQTISFNAYTLGRHFFDEPNQERVDALLIHEFAHDAVHDHLSERFYSECCRLGAKLRTFEVKL